LSVFYPMDILSSEDTKHPTDVGKQYLWIVL